MGRHGEDLTDNRYTTPCDNVKASLIGLPTVPRVCDRIDASEEVRRRSEKKRLHAWKPEGLNN